MYRFIVYRRVQSDPGKPGKSAYFEKTQGKPGKLRGKN